MQAQYTNNKRATLASFLDFAEGGELPYWPLEVFLEVSNICDLKCVMCPTFSALSPHRLTNLHRNERGLMPVEIGGLQSLDSILKHALRVHAFGYGEPTVHPQFKEMIETLSAYEVIVDFFSHGMHLTDDVCAFLVAAGVVRITISFSGANKNDYENVYLGGDFERVLAGIKRLADHKARANSSFPEIEINSLGFHHHIEHLPEFVRLMAENGVNTINVKPLHVNELIELKRHKSFMHPGKEKLKIEESKKLASELGIKLASKPYELSEKAAIGYDEAMSRMSDDELQSLVKQHMDEYVPLNDLGVIASSKGKKQQSQKILKKYQESEKKQFYPIELDNWFQHEGTPCMEPFKTFYANFDGKVYTCCFRRSKDYIGQLNEQAGEEIWTNERYQTIKQEALNNRYLQEMCKVCMKRNAYPRSHGLQLTYNYYVRWYQERYGEAFLPDLAERIRQVPDNETILARHQKK